MPNIVINHVGSNTEIQSDSTPISYVTSAATVTDVDDTHISVTVGGVPIITMDINDITSIDGAAPYGNAEQVVSQITGQSAPAGTPTLSQVLTAGASAGAKITNLTDPTADQDAATKKYVDDNAGGLGYDVYAALLTQTGTDAPVVDFSTSTLPQAIVWARTDVGIYEAPYTIVDPNKIIAISGRGWGNYGTTIQIFPDTNKLVMFTADPTNANADGVLNRTEIFIYVYP